MRLIMNPKVTLIARPQVLKGNIEAWLEEHNFEMPTLDEAQVASHIITEFGGRLCYMSFANPRPGGNQTYIDHIKKEGHGSVMEHSNYTFLVEDVSLNLTHELVRHRAGMAYSQLSGRYVDRGNDQTGFVVPDMLKKIMHSRFPNREAVLRPFTAQCENQIAAYINLRDGMMDFLEWAVINDSAWTLYNRVAKTDRLKAVRGAARSVLGGALETKILVTANIRAIRHILEMRASEAADAEICKMGMLMFDLVNDDHHFTDYTTHTSNMGRQFLRTEWEKV